MKSALEKAMEKMAGVGEITSEEKTRIKDEEQLKSVLAEFYKGHLDRDRLWQELKGIGPSVLREAQHRLADSLRLGGAPEEFTQRKDGILAIEALKSTQNTSAVENMLSSLETLQKDYREGREAAIEQLRAQIEANPRLKLRPVRTPDGKTVLRPALSVDEAVQAKLAEFLEGHEQRYADMFDRLIAMLRRELH